MSKNLMTAALLCAAAFGTASLHAEEPKKEATQEQPAAKDGAPKAEAKESKSGAAAKEKPEKADASKEAPSGVDRPSASAQGTTRVGAFWFITIGK